MEAIWHRLRKKNILTSKQSPLDNIFHCSIYKAASQWFYDLFENPIFYKNTGLSTYKYQIEEINGFDPRPMNARFSTKRFRFEQLLHLYTLTTLVTNLFLNHLNIELSL